MDKQVRSYQSPECYRGQDQQNSNVSIPALNSPTPQFESSPEFVPNKAQKIEERYLQRSSSKILSN
jgi:hypothetical protein